MSFRNNYNFVTRTPFLQLILFPLNTSSSKGPNLSLTIRFQIPRESNNIENVLETCDAFTISSGVRNDKTAWVTSGGKISPKKSTKLNYQYLKPATI